MSHRPLSNTSSLKITAAYWSYLTFFMSASDLQGLVSVETYLRTVRQAIGRMFDLKKMLVAEELRRFPSIR
jgi:hypothetical protein